MNNATVRLSFGEYTFHLLQMRNWSNLTFDLTDDPIVINVANDVEIQNNVTMAISSAIGNAADILF